MDEITIRSIVEGFTKKSLSRAQYTEKYNNLCISDRREVLRRLGSDATNFRNKIRNQDVDDFWEKEKQ